MITSGQATAQRIMPQSPRLKVGENTARHHFMICPVCNSQVPDGLSVCPYCGQPFAVSPTSAAGASATPAVDNIKAMPQPAMPELVEKHHLDRAIRARHWQRWFFYGFIVLLFLAAIGIIVNMNNANSDLIAKMATADQNLQSTTASLNKTTTDLGTSQQSLATTKSQLADMTAKYTQAQQDLDAKSATLQSMITQSTDISQQLKTAQADSSAAAGNIRALILRLAVPISNQNIAKIPVAVTGLNVGPDSDNDGLSDQAEIALGTDAKNVDTNHNGHNDLQDLTNGYDPSSTSKSKFPVDQKFANGLKGKIVLETQRGNAAWYIYPQNGERYFLGLTADGYAAMREMAYWTSGYKGTQ